MQKWVMAILLLAAVIVGGAGLVNQVSLHAKENAPEDPNAGPSVKFVVMNYKFDQPEYTVKAGVKVTLKLQLKEGIHEVAIPDFNVKLDKNNPTQVVSFDKPGTYDVHCVLPCGPGHPDMKTKLIVQ